MRRDQPLGQNARLDLLGTDALAGFERAHALQQSLLEGAANRHHLANQLHLRPERFVSAREFLELPLGNLYDDIVERRLETCWRLASDVVGDFIERVADRELGGDLGNGESRRLRRQRRRARHAGIHLNDHHASVVGIHGELNIRSAGLHANLADHSDGGVTHRLIFTVGEGLGRRYGDRVASGDAHGIEVLDRTDDDDVVGQIAHQLELVFLPAKDGFLEQNFVYGREVEAPSQQFEQLFAVVGDAAAGSTEGKRRAENDRETDLAAEVEAIFQIVDQRRFRHLEADLRHCIFEEQAVFALLDGVQLRSDELGAELLEDPGVGQLDCEVERGLSANGGQDSEDAWLFAGCEHLRFDADNLFEIGDRERLDVGAVGHLRISHDGGWVGVHQYHFVAFRFERLAGLRA